MADAAVCPDKRYTFVLCLFKTSKSQVLDDLGEMLVKKLRKLHNDARIDLAEWRAKNQSKTEELIARLEKVAEAATTGRNKSKKLREIEKALGQKPEEVKRDCESYAAYSENNYLPFVLPRFSSLRNTLFDILEELILLPTTDDQGLLSAVRFIKLHRQSKEEKVFTYKMDASKVKRLVEFEWVSKKWWKILTGQTTPGRVTTWIKRKHFEVCVFSQIADDLRSGDLAVHGAKNYSDFRDELISKVQYEREVKGFSEQIGLPFDQPKLFVQILKLSFMKLPLALIGNFLKISGFPLKMGDLQSLEDRGRN